MPNVSHKPTKEGREIVKNMAMAGLVHDAIAKSLDISKPTLRKHYRDELDFGAAGCNAAVAGVLFRKAMDGDTASCIFWMKTKGGWRESMNLDHSSEDGSMSPPRSVKVIGVSA